MSDLPNAEPQHPACGCCQGETCFDSDQFYCEDCQLSFDAETFTASFLDERVAPCGVPCDNYWHQGHKIKQGLGFDCGTCKLPTGHMSMHWTGCQPQTLMQQMDNLYDPAYDRLDYEPSWAVRTT